MGKLSRKDALPLRKAHADAERTLVARPDPRLGMEVMPWRMMRALTARCPVILGGDYPLVLAGIRSVLATETGLRVAGAVEGAGAALREPGISVGVLVVASAQWTDSHAEALAGLRGQAPGVRVVLLSDEADEARRHQFRLAGGRALLPLRASEREVLAAVRAARPPLSADWAASETGLSEREALVLRHKANGHPNKAIAERLGLSVKTVETYYTRGMEKLGLKSRAEMLRYGVAQGWISSAV